MANRTITTSLKLDGEAEYKRKLSEVNGELRTLKSELSLAETEFKGQANSLDFLAKKQKLLTDSMEAQRAKVATLEEAVKKTTEAYGAADSRTNRYQQSLNRAKAELIELNRALDENGKYLGEAEQSFYRHAASIDEYGNAVRDAGDASGEMGEKSGNAMDALSRALTGAGAVMAARELAAVLRECVSASVEFESAMAGVAKVTKGSDAEMAAMAEGIRQMSTELPATTGEIAAVAESAARLGVAQEDILSFSRVMLDLGESSNLSAEEAATALARFANIAGTSSADYERLGSVIVALGNNFATSESEITAMASRLASAGTLAGLSESQIMALAAAMSSVGIEAEAGGTAMTQTLTAMEKAVSSGGAALERFGEISGMSAEGFAQRWSTDAMGAVQAFISGLGSLDEQGESATEVLEELGMSGVRQGNMLKSLALASETLAGTVALAGEAWEENSALAETAAARYATTESQMTMLSNAADNVKIAVGDALTPVLGELAEAGTEAFSWAAEVLTAHPELVAGLTGVATALGVLVAGVAIHNVVIPAASVAMGAFNLALNANPAILAAAAISGIVVALTALISKLRAAKDETEDLAEEEASAGEEAEAAAEQTAALAEASEKLSKAAEESAKTQKDSAKAAKDLRDQSLDLTGATDELSKALKEQEERGSVSLKTALRLIDAGYASALAVDQETGALTVNQAAYLDLTRAKIDDQIASLETQRQSEQNRARLEMEAQAAGHAGSVYWEAAVAKAAMDKGDTAALDAQIAALQAARTQLNSFSYAAGTAARTRSSSSKKVKTQAERDLAEYKALTAELDHQRSMDALSEEDYYRRLEEYRDRYLSAEDNLESWRKVTEKIYDYDRELGEKEAQLWIQQTEALTAELKKRTEAVEAEQAAMRERLAGYGDLFTVRDEELALESIQDQIDAINRYEEALTGLRERGVSGSLMDEVLGMDVDSASQYAEQLLAMSEEQWAEYNALWEEKQQRALEVSEQFYRDALEALDTEYNSELGKALDALEDTAFQSGMDTVRGLIEGLQAQEGALYAKAAQIASNAASILSSAGIPSNAALSSSLSTGRIREPGGGVTARDLTQVGEGIVNGIAAVSGNGGRLTVNMNIDGKTLYTETIDDLRAVARANPEVRNDA